MRTALLAYTFGTGLAGIALIAWIVVCEAGPNLKDAGRAVGRRHALIK